MAKRDQISALERVINNPASSPHTVMEASKEIRRLTSRRRPAPRVVSSAQQRVDAWWGERGLVSPCKVDAKDRRDPDVIVAELCTERAVKIERAIAAVRSAFG